MKILVGLKLNIHRNIPLLRKLVLLTLITLTMSACEV